MNVLLDKSTFIRDLLCVDKWRTQRRIGTYDTIRNNLTVASVLIDLKGSSKESFTRGDYSEITNFGYDDIAFYDENNNYILVTTTHEGNIAINNEII